MLQTSPESVDTCEEGLSAKEIQLLRSKPRPQTPLYGVHVLLVEDAVENIVLLKTWLERSGALVEIARNGQEGIDQALSFYPEVILMDLHMPVMDGHEAMRTLRRNGFERPIVALTAHAVRGERDYYLREGFDRYLTKPVSLIELVRTVSELSPH